MKIKWFDPVTINGVTFCKGDNGQQLFYEIEQDGLHWVILRPHIIDPVLPGQESPRDGRAHIPWWAAHVWRGESVCNLNLCCLDWHRNETRGPLYECTDSGYADPPMMMLAEIANWVHIGVDPWTLKERVVPASDIKERSKGK